MAILQEIKRYTPPELKTGKEWYISFNAFDPILGKMKRKKIKLNHISGVGERRKYARDLINRLSVQLSNGWNPWIESENSNAYRLFTEVIDSYRDYLDKLLKDGVYREETYRGYISAIKNLELWNQARKTPITYIYQMDKEYIVEFLDHIYIDRDNSMYTRDNYLTTIGIFAHWCIQKNYIKTDPTAGITLFGRRLKKKKRILLSDIDLKRLMAHLEQDDKYYLLACYILFYCFIRPKEMGNLQLFHFSLAKQTVFIPDSVSKNKKDGTITLPAKVIHLMVELNIFDSPSNYYLFSEKFRPGPKKKSEKCFRDKWLSIRKILKFPETYKFYSLKDSGITAMLRSNDVLTVRDQARHSSILMTDTYTPHDIQKANDLIKNYDGVF